MQKIKYAKNKLVTLTAVQPEGRFGNIELSGTDVTHFQEKPASSGAWVNGGFFVLSPDIGRYIDGDQTAWEVGPMNRLCADQQVNAYRHNGFWHCMDTLRDKTSLENYWNQGAPWKIW